MSLSTQSGISNTQTQTGYDLAQAYPDGFYIGASATYKVGFYGKTPVVQQSTIAAVATTAATTTTPWGFTTSTQANAIVSDVNAILAALKTYGLIAV